MHHLTCGISSLLHSFNFLRNFLRHSDFEWIIGTGQTETRCNTFSYGTRQLQVAAMWSFINKKIVFCWLLCSIIQTPKCVCMFHYLTAKKHDFLYRSLILKLLMNNCMLDREDKTFSKNQNTLWSQRERTTACIVGRCSCFIYITSHLQKTAEQC